MKKNTFILILVIIIATLVTVFILRFYKNKNVSDLNLQTEAVSNKDIVEELNIKENTLQPIVTSSEYKELTKKAHESYITGKYEKSLEYLTQALKIEKNDRIYMSLYGVHLALKNYEQAEKAIQLSINLNGTIASKWIDYANLKNYYLKASFETVSVVYKQALLETKNHIDIVTSYASYLKDFNKNEAVVMWQKAIELHPENKAIYQAEIDRLK